MSVECRLGALTGRQARAALERRPVLLLPLGSLEAHGPDLPMGDYLSAERIAVLIAERADAEGRPCLVAPVLPFGGADAFGSVPGAIALRQRRCVRCWRTCSPACCGTGWTGW